ncbi:glycosyltransferase [Candidatus Microgenomates bacterium]|nr:glycosyltransferase [Candidatus Microgenomates bacterium]
MHIGIDASRAFLKERTGTEEYSYQLIKALANQDRKNKYTLYVRSDSEGELRLPSNFKFKVIPWPRLWTQIGLTLECLFNPPDVLFVPAHTIPVLRRPGLKTVAVIHDLGAEFLPGYHQFPQKLYLNRSTEYVARHATAIIAVSKNTKNDLIRKLKCQPEKINIVYEGFKTKGLTGNRE